MVGSRPGEAAPEGGPGDCQMDREEEKGVGPGVSGDSEVVRPDAGCAVGAESGHVHRRCPGRFDRSDAPPDGDAPGDTQIQGAGSGER